MENISLIPVEILVQSVDIVLDTLINYSLHNIQKEIPDVYNDLSRAKRELEEILRRYRESQNQIEQLEMRVNALRRSMNLYNAQIQRYSEA